MTSDTAGGLSIGSYRRHLMVTTMILVTILPLPLQGFDLFRSAVGENAEEELSSADKGSINGLQQAVTQLTERFTTMETSIESRLVRLTDTAVKGDSLLEALTSRLEKMDDLVEKVDALDSRLTQETAFLQATLRDTKRDLQNVATQLERLDSRVKAGDGSRHDTRSNLPGKVPSDAELLNTLITRRFGEMMERSIPRMLNATATSIQTTILKHVSKNFDEMRRDSQRKHEELLNYSNHTLQKASEVGEDMHTMAKKVYDAFQDSSNQVTSAREDIMYEIKESSMSSLELRPVLQQVNQSVAQSVAKAAEGLNITLREEAARRRGTEDPMRSEYHPLHCPDPTTVAALQEVKYLLQSVLKKSDDLRRGLTKQTSEGVDLLKLLHQRFSVLLRRMNTDPDHSRQLVAEMQDLGSLVESSYTAVLVAQNAFIESCKRIQDDEPTLELKIAEILDKLVTDIQLGHKFNRIQLSELRRLVEQLTEANATSTRDLHLDRSAEGILSDLQAGRDLSLETSTKVSEVRDTILGTIKIANSTASRLEDVQERIDTVSRELVDVDWSNVRQKEPADQLVTAAKDLRGYAREQIVQSLNLNQALLTALEEITMINAGPANDSLDQPPDLTVPLSDESHSHALPALTLPDSCTVALLDQMRKLPKFKKLVRHTTISPTEEAVVEDEDEDEYEYDEDIPAWYTDPDFLSGNYGTPDLDFPVFREDEWRDISDYANDEFLFIDRSASSESSSSSSESGLTITTSTTTAMTGTTPEPSRLVPGGVDRFFGVMTTPHRSSTSKRASGKQDAFT